MAENIVEGLRSRTEKKKKLVNSLHNLEKQIYALETNYLEDTPYGNVILGWEGYSAAGRGFCFFFFCSLSLFLSYCFVFEGRTVPKKHYSDSDRIFSLSSVTACEHVPIEDQPIVLLKKQKGEDDAGKVVGIPKKDKEEKSESPERKKKKKK